MVQSPVYWVRCLNYWPIAGEGMRKDWRFGAVDQTMRYGILRGAICRKGSAMD